MYYCMLLTIVSGCSNTASVSSKSFLTHHTNIHDMMKGKLALHKLPDHSPDLQRNFESRLTEMKLNGLC